MEINPVKMEPTSSVGVGEGSLGSTKRVLRPRLKRPNYTSRAAYSDLEEKACGSFAKKAKFRYSGADITKKAKLPYSGADITNEERLLIGKEIRLLDSMGKLVSEEGERLPIHWKHIKNKLHLKHNPTALAGDYERYFELYFQDSEDAKRKADNEKILTDAIFKAMKLDAQGAKAKKLKLSEPHARSSENVMWSATGISRGFTSDQVEVSREQEKDPTSDPAEVPEEQDEGPSLLEGMDLPAS